MHAAFSGPRGGRGREHVGSYHLLEVIGRGSRSTIYRAQAPGGELVAVKIPRPEVDRLTRATRLMHEYAVLGRITHPNVVRLLDAGELGDGTPYLVFELVGGESLARIVERTGPLPLRRVHGLAVQLLSACAAVHAAGFVHCDINSANLLVEATGDGEAVKLVDFSAAGLLGTLGGGGTPAYLAPELISGSAPSRSSDIYACGAVLYEMLTGTPPFTGATVRDLLLRKTLLPIDPPSSRRGGSAIAPRLDAVVLGALARIPAARPASCDELARAFTEALFVGVAS
ncbi:MAG TPA: serine/threonine-protein kinase [Kofleriaceae bacterium]|nr:serine/threonine-protein kinase [Kofleriaceae bacterium]